ALRTTFVREADALIQRIGAPPTWELPVYPDASALRAEATRPFDLACGPLLRTALFRVGPREHLLLIVLHHAVCDGWSMGVLFRELGALYAAGREGRADPLPPLPIQVADVAVWQRQALAGSRLEALLAYWEGALAGAPPLVLPADRPR